MKKKIKLKDLTKEQYQKWLDENCNLSNCKKCIFNNIFCQIGSSCCWIDYKNYCSKKFLNKKIRIEKEIKEVLKEEIKKADIKELGTNYMNLILQEISNVAETYNFCFDDNINYRQYKRLAKNLIKDSNRCFKERNKIMHLCPSIKGYVKFVLERIKGNSDKIFVKPFPGIYLKEYIYENMIFLEDFADDLGISTTELLLILDGKARITEELALKLSEVMGTSSEVWINLQKSYDQSIIIDKANQLGFTGQKNLTLGNFVINFDPDTYLLLKYDDKVIYCGTSDPGILFDIIDEKFFKLEIESISSDVLDDIDCSCISIVLKDGGDK